MILQPAEIIELIYQLVGAVFSDRGPITVMMAIVSGVARRDLRPFALHFGFAIFLDDTRTFLNLILEVLDLVPILYDR